MTLGGPLYDHRTVMTLLCCTLVHKIVVQLFAVNSLSLFSFEAVEAKITAEQASLPVNVFYRLIDQVIRVVIVHVDFGLLLLLQIRDDELSQFHLLCHVLLPQTDIHLFHPLQFLTNSVFSCRQRVGK